MLLTSQATHGVGAIGWFARSMIWTAVHPEGEAAALISWVFR